MFTNATVSSRSSSSRSGNSCSRNSSMPSLRMRNPLSPKTSYNPFFRHSDAFTSFDASHFIFQEHKSKEKQKKQQHPVLRRYNSHESHANFDIRIDSKNNTPDSTKSRVGTNGSSITTGSDSTGDRKLHEFEARDFLERYSLPRVVRVGNGEPLLLYRCFDSFTKVQAKGLCGKKGKERVDNKDLYFPEGYSGWFSLTNERGETSAVAHTSILELVREQVCSFISMQTFTAYAAQSGELTDAQGKVQYLKTQVRGGQLFQLRAVFQHKERPDGSGGRNSTRSSRISRSARDKDLANRYAQLVSQTNQELYVPLVTKGEFYELHSSMKARLCFPGMLHKTGPLALDKDCLYKITHLLRRVSLPVKVKLMAGPLPSGLPKDFTDTFILERKFQEPLMVTCTLPPPTADAKHDISCINLNSNVKISKCTLGFDSENRLFKSQRLQAALAFCHKNVESWYREVRIAPNLQEEQDNLQEMTVDIPCLECKRLVNCDENCSKYDRCNEDTCEKQLISKEVLEKFPKPKKWYKHFQIFGSNGGSSPERYNVKEVEVSEKGKSIERYKDMSKLIEEKFGKKSYNPVKKSASFMFSTKRIDLEETPQENSKSNPALLKCQSLDTQLHSIEEYNKHNHRKNSTSNISDNLSNDFRLCILENENSIIEPKTKSSILLKSETILQPQTKIVEILQSEEEEEVPKLRKTKPDLIPTLPKDDNQDHSYITERLCSGFHVKTKVQKKSKPEIRGSGRYQQTNLSIYEEQQITQNHVKSVIVQVHEVRQHKKVISTSKNFLNVEELPYSNVADEVCERPSGRKNSDENIYAEICESSPCTCDSKLCECKRTKKDSEYCYVKLGSNGDSVTQSDSDEAIYNTLR